MDSFELNVEGFDRCDGSQTVLERKTVFWCFRFILFSRNEMEEEHKSEGDEWVHNKEFLSEQKSLFYFEKVRIHSENFT